MDISFGGGRVLLIDPTWWGSGFHCVIDGIQEIQDDPGKLSDACKSVAKAILVGLACTGQNYTPLRNLSAALEVIPTVNDFVQFVKAPKECIEAICCGAVDPFELINKCALAVVGVVGSLVWLEGLGFQELAVLTASMGGSFCLLGSTITFSAAEIVVVASLIASGAEFCHQISVLRHAGPDEDCRGTYFKLARSIIEIAVTIFCITQWGHEGAVGVMALEGAASMLALPSFVV